MESFTIHRERQHSTLKMMSGAKENVPCFYSLQQEQRLVGDSPSPIVRSRHRISTAAQLREMTRPTTCRKSLSSLSALGNGRITSHLVLKYRLFSIGHNPCHINVLGTSDRTLAGLRYCETRIKIRAVAGAEYNHTAVMFLDASFPSFIVRSIQQQILEARTAKSRCLGCIKSYIDCLYVRNFVLPQRLLANSKTSKTTPARLHEPAPRNSSKRDTFLPQKTST